MHQDTKSAQLIAVCKRTCTLRHSLFPYMHITPSQSFFCIFKNLFHITNHIIQVWVVTQHTFSNGISFLPIGTSAPVLDMTKTCLILGHLSTASSTVFFSSIVLPPRTPWSAVITVSAPARRTEIPKFLNLQCP